MLGDPALCLGGAKPARFVLSLGGSARMRRHGINVHRVIPAVSMEFWQIV
jgi:hypothetical protein